MELQAAAGFLNIWHHPREFVPGSVLTEKLGFSRQALFKHICALREEGLEITSVPQKGYMIKNISGTDLISQTLIDHLLRDEPLFNRSICFSTITSTQHAIKKLANRTHPRA